MSPDGHAGHHPALAHHFENLGQQSEASTLGMWVFLVTEVLFFGGLFLVYSVYRSWFPEGFAFASHELDVTLGQGFHFARPQPFAETIRMAVAAPAPAELKTRA